MNPYWKFVNRSLLTLVLRTLFLLLWAMRRLFRLLLQRPMLEWLLLVLVLWFLAGFIGKFTQPESGLEHLPTVLDGR
jgi:hypothetical protein